MTFQVSTEYLSIGANRHPSAADWHSSGLLAYGAENNIALWYPEDNGSRGIIDILTGHTDSVNAVKFLPGHEGALLSGSVDHNLMIWKRDLTTGKYSLAQTLEYHESSINCVAVSSKIPNIFVSGSADARVNVWSNEKDSSAILLQTIEIIPRFFPLALALTSVQGSPNSCILAVAGTKNIIQLYVLDLEKPSNFNLQATLTSHDGWIRSLDFINVDPSPQRGDIFLSSASQDKYIRIWRIHHKKETKNTTTITDKQAKDINYSKLLSNKIYRLKVESHDLFVTFEALLSGHEDWIYSAKWKFSGEKLRLLSASADNSLAIWEPDSATGVFTITTRLGEISSEKGSTTATGSTGGFWIGLWSPSGETVTCLGRTGSWRMWKWNTENDRWSQVTGISGHTRAVNSIAWSKKGECLLSTSSDQTTRLHAKWYQGSGHQSWHEMARPQIHGYDLFCISWLDSSRFVSAAEEKLLRVFKQPKTVRELLSKLCGLRLMDDEEAPEAANMPVLGLSNKMVGVNSRETDKGSLIDQDETNLGLKFGSTKLNLQYPPLEDQLSKFTLWPELEKLYGHGNQISALAISHDGSIIATACKASSIDHAIIRLFETKDWLEIKPPLVAHSLTVMNLKFSTDDSYLLSVGRDRQWALFRRSLTASHIFTLEQSKEPAHLRMILDVAWAPEEMQAFATVGRDKQTKVWLREESEEPKSLFTSKITIPDTNPVTAVDFLGTILRDDTLCLATGNEIGDVKVYYLNLKILSVNEIILQYPGLYLNPIRRINQLSWRPMENKETENELEIPIELAVASEDSSVRIFSMVQVK